MRWPRYMPTECKLQTEIGPSNDCSSKSAKIIVKNLIGFFHCVTAMIIGENDTWKKQTSSVDIAMPRKSHTIYVANVSPLRESVYVLPFFVIGTEQTHIL